MRNKYVMLLPNTYHKGESWIYEIPWSVPVYKILWKKDQTEIKTYEIPWSVPAYEILWKIKIKYH